MRIEFPPCERAADPVIRVEGLRFGYTQVPLFEGLDLTVRRGDRIAIVGANGMGKTTLLRLIGGELTPDAGSIKLGRNAAMSLAVAPLTVGATMALAPTSPAVCMAA